MKDGDDARNVYNPDKKPDPWHNYEKKNNQTSLATDEPLQ